MQALDTNADFILITPEDSIVDILKVLILESGPDTVDECFDCAIQELDRELI